VILVEIEIQLVFKILNGEEIQTGNYNFIHQQGYMKYMKDS